MSEGMLGLLSFREVRGVLGDLMDKLVSVNGPLWLGELKKFLNREACWVERVDEEEMKRLIEYWKSLGNRSTIPPPPSNS